MKTYIICEKEYNNSYYMTLLDISSGQKKLIL